MDRYEETIAMMLPLVIGILLGGIVGVIAEQKNRPFFPWAIYGFFFFFFAIIHIAVIGDKTYEVRQLEGMGYKKCPACAEVIKSEAVLCNHCNTAVVSDVSVVARAQADLNRTGGKTCRWCKHNLGKTEVNKCPSCGGLQKHFLKDNPVLLILVFCLVIAFLMVLGQVENESPQPLSSSEETASF